MRGVIIEGGAELQRGRGRDTLLSLWTSAVKQSPFSRAGVSHTLFSILARVGSETRVLAMATHATFVPWRADACVGEFSVCIGCCGTCGAV